eukprot:TRINITY_DN44602_c0_g1_i1.p1 TRINITY_DN44602_c0_g1~~TRINITY_DN44602_c0_g1_i1.p1  ORF type:complete len:443 (+),score=93.09 TRINITY_DN44602_c0_g1_i1:60-1388(+)
MALPLARHLRTRPIRLSPASSVSPLLGVRRRTGGLPSLRCFSAGGGDAKWAEELERRRKERESGATEERLGSMPQQPSAAQTSTASEGAAPPEPEIDDASREEVGRRAQQLELFAYPADRTFPYGTASLLAMSGGLTAAAALYWNFSVTRATSLDELRPRLQTFTSCIGACSAGQEDLSAGAVHQLLLTSLFRGGEWPARVFADAAVLLSCGALLERLHGTPLVLGLAVGSTVVSNALAVVANEAMLTRSGVPPRGVPVPAAQQPGDESSSLQGPNVPKATISSTSPAVVTLGVLCMLRHGRWAAWPGIPVPIAWLLAPVLVADTSAALLYLRQTAAYTDVLAEAAPSNDAAAATASEDAASEAQLSGLPLAVALAACEAVEERSHADCRPPAPDVASWHQELEMRLDVELPSLPNGAFWADVMGCVVGLIAAVFLKRPLRP